MDGDVLEIGSTWLAEQFKDHASRKVRYERDGSFVLLDVTVGRTEYQETDGYGGLIAKWTDRDFIFLAADLVLGGKFTKPEEGDKVYELDEHDSITRTYEVMAIPDAQCFRYCDPQRQGLRAHTKQTAET